MKEFDVVVIGAGPVGLATGMYSGRLGSKTLIIGKEIGGTILLTEKVENYPGFKSIKSTELVEKFKEHALVYQQNVEIIEKEVVGAKREGERFVLRTADEEFSCKAVIIATGSKHRELDIQGSKEFLNKGVHYCALCDGPFYSKKTVAVIGGSDSSVIETLILSKYAEKVYIIYRRDKLRAEQSNLDDLKKANNVEVIYNTNVTDIKGSQFVEKVVLDNPHNGSNELAVDAVFVAIGYIPISELAVKLGVELNEKRQIKINRKSETNVPGVYAAGDVTDSDFKQIVTGVGEGVDAAFHASKFIG
jgi:thioredoxin reductase (NADPH)